MYGWLVDDRKEKKICYLPTKTMSKSVVFGSIAFGFAPPPAKPLELA